MLTFAELWMGTHPSGPAKVSSSTFLLDVLKQHNEIIGVVPDGYAVDDLPFLFKVLSIQTALSIQAHPDKSRAVSLNARFPDLYKDPNHKPEMVIALSDFECLSGFRTQQEILQLFQEYPEFEELVKANGFSPSHAQLAEGEFLRHLFLAYMRSEAAIVAQLLQSMVQRLRLDSDRSSLTELLLRLYEQYPDDIGVFAPLVLNFLNLKSGDSFFIGPNVPHAYISGDCVECMALSDNVVRAGLTPKLRDVDTLCEMLTYDSGKPAFIETIAIDDNTQLYRPPKAFCAEFEVEYISWTEVTSVELRALPAASLILTLEAPSAASVSIQQLVDSDILHSELSLKQGSVFFLAANVAAMVTTSGSGRFVMYRAHVNLA
jgi:mannose-6-phosphate isomerase